jgi:hypothetical protein
MSSIIKPSYGSDGQAITITLTSLGASGGARESAAVDNSTDLFLDALVQVKTKTGAGTIGSDPYLYLYVLGSDDGGTTWPSPATGTDASVSTPDNNTKAKLLGAVHMPSASTAYKSNLFSVLQAFGGIAIPKKWSILALNQTGVSLSSTAGDHAVTFQGVQAQIV